MDDNPIPPNTYRLTMIFTLEESRQLVELMELLDQGEYKELISEFKLAIQKNSKLANELRKANILKD